MMANPMLLQLAVSLVAFQDSQSNPTDDCAEVQTLVVEVTNGAELQVVLARHAAKDGKVRIGKPNSLVCTALESIIDGETSRHALLISNGIDLDLNGSTLLLDLRLNSHGVRLSSRSSIRKEAAMGFWIVYQGDESQVARARTVTFRVTARFTIILRDWLPQSAFHNARTWFVHEPSSVWSDRHFLPAAIERRHASIRSANIQRRNTFDMGMGVGHRAGSGAGHNYRGH